MGAHLATSSNLQHDHKHTPCRDCDCAIALHADGKPICEGARCEDCLRTRPCFGDVRTAAERESRIWLATHDRLTLEIEPGVQS